MSAYWIRAQHTHASNPDTHENKIKVVQRKEKQKSKYSIPAYLVHNTRYMVPEKKNKEVNTPYRHTWCIIPGIWYQKRKTKKQILHSGIPGTRYIVPGRNIKEMLTHEEVVRPIF